MNHELQNKIMLGVVIAICVAFAVGGFYMGYRINQYKSELIGSDKAYEELAGELRATTLALGKATDANSRLEKGLGAIGAERDALVEQFSILRDAVTGLEFGADGSYELAIEGAIMVEAVITILEAVEACGIWGSDP
jgi:hypothetical protein